MIELFRQFDGMVDRVKLIVNRVGSFDSEISPRKAEETLKMPISWLVPNASRPFQEARIKGVPLADVAKGCRAHHVFLELARAIRPAGAESASKPRKGLFAAFF
jgi:pilus assembly protein CpaE